MDDYLLHNDDFENSYRKKCIIDNKEEIISVINETLIVKNPKNLSPFFNNIKGIIDNKGNLYVSSSNYNIIHSDILNVLYSKNIISKFDFIDIYKKIPFDFLSIQRIWNKNIFTYSNSYCISDIDKDKFSKKVNLFFNKCKKVNEHLEFTNDDLISAGNKYLNKLELKNFYKSFYF